jgi:UPF0176 protein
METLLTPALPPSTWHVVALYRFVTLEDTAAVQAQLQPTLKAWGVVGTLLLAPEGVNGTLAAPFSETLEDLVQVLDDTLGVRQGEIKYATASEKPFRRLRVRLKKEIITMRQETARPDHCVGTYVDPQDWNALIQDPDVLVLDTRNAYEVSIGTFQNAVNPNTERFTEFAPFVESRYSPATHKKVAMFCTGGIRCEKASSYMLQQGFEEVYHLKGGILNYLEQVSASESTWQGACYVFDRRVGVRHGLQESGHLACHGCGWPLALEDTHHPDYEEGVSCARCRFTTAPDRLAAFRTRQQQMTHSSD